MSSSSPSLRGLVRLQPPREISRRFALVLAGAIAFLAAVFSVGSANADANLGPHRATFEVTWRSAVTLDLGPFGAVFMDSPVSPLGADITVHEIPVVSNADLVSALTSDLTAYSQLISEPAAAVSQAVDALITDALGRFTLITCAGLAVLAYLRERRIRVTPRQVLGTGLVATIALTATALPQWTKTRPESERAQVLAGTPFETLEVTGRLGAVINTYGPLLLDELDRTEAFYDSLAVQLAAFPVKTAEPAPMSGWDRPVTPSSEELVTAVFASDLHCNVSVGHVVNALAEAAGADFIINGGDTVVSGTSAEQFCVDAFAGAFTVPVIVADGNHDSVTTGEQERAAGWTVLDGGVVEFGGLTFLGDSDPYLTEIGQGTRRERDEDIETLGVRMAEAACEAERADGTHGVDVLLIHNPAAATATLDAGCARIGLSGHIHRQVGPDVISDGVWQLVNSSTGGGNAGGRTIGTLESDAHMTVLQFWNGAPWRYSVVTLNADETVTVEPWRFFPQATDGL